MKKLFLSALLCVMLLATLLPAAAYAAEDGYVLINGQTVSIGTPYYFDGGGTSQEPTKNGLDWIAHLEKNEDATYTLHLRNFILDTIEPYAIQTNGIETLYLDLEGDNNEIITRNDDNDSSPIKCDDLIVCGDGYIELFSQQNGYGINARSIRLQYSAGFYAFGTSNSTNVKVTCSEGAAMYKAADPSGDEITDYFTNNSPSYSIGSVRFTPKTDARFPIWVNNERVTASNMGNVLGDAGETVKYTPADGATPAVLTLNNATINRASTSGHYRGGVYAEEALELRLKGSSSIEFQTSSSDNSNDYVSGVLVNGPSLTITAAEPGASLNSRVMPLASSTQANCCGIFSGGSGNGNITINGGNINADGYADASKGFGIYAGGSLTVNGGSVIARGEGRGESIAVRANNLTLGTGMAILTPVGAIAPDGPGGDLYIKDGAGNEAARVEFGRARYAVTYDANGGSGTMAPGTATDGAAFTLPDNGFTAPAGTLFREWAIGSTGGTKVAAGGTYPFTADTTVYAVWSNTYALTVLDSYVDATGVPTGAGDYVEGKTVSVHAGARPGYTFAGWTVVSGDVRLNDPGSASTFFTMPGSAVTIKAKWTDNNDSEPDPVEYQIITGPSGGYVKGAVEGLSFTANGRLSGFNGVRVDGRALMGGFSATGQNSTVITLEPDYLETLAPGEHTLRIYFTDGYAEGRFTVNSHVEPPQTGDNATPALWLGVLLTAGAGLAASAILWRKRERE